MKHTHTCQTCAHVWTCEDSDWRHLPVEKCGVTVAAKVNGNGPVCLLCLSLEMAKRHAGLRGLELIVTPRKIRP